jgi:uncharacterized membrane protein YkgB
MEDSVHSSVLETTIQVRPSYASRVEAAGAGIVRWSIVVLLVLFGALKWTAAEATAIAPFIANSPALRWLAHVFEPQRASEFIGVAEFVIALLIALRHWAPRVSMVGGFLGTMMFVTTLSFIITTPGIGDGVGFLLKDLTLLGGSLWTAGESWRAVERESLVPNRLNSTTASGRVGVEGVSRRA